MSKIIRRMLLTPLGTHRKVREPDRATDTTTNSKQQTGRAREPPIRSACKDMTAYTLTSESNFDDMVTCTLRAEHGEPSTFH